jgi:sugar phosphate isomerase/epimerase
MDKILLSTERHDLAAHREWAEERGFGLELQAFSDPKVLSGNWQEVLAEHQQQLAHFRGPLGLHGAFYDMVSASLDPEVVALTRKRYRQNLRIAADLGVSYVVFHLNYMGILKLPNYRPAWHQRQVEFWRPFSEEAAGLGLTVLLENLWEDDPELITNILEEVSNPHLRACLDVAHATLFSSLPAAAWIERMAPHVHCCHLNNHDGQLDLHLPLNEGVVEYRPILHSLRHLLVPPFFVLEMGNRQRMAASLPYFDLPANSTISH